MSKFTCIGRAVTHTARPRFTIIYTPRDDGSYDGLDVEWIDKPPPDVKLLARLMRECGEFFAGQVHRD